jgi:CRISPR-associated exonuclease Cas4
MYCPRIPFYTYCLPVPHRPTYKMQEGKEEHMHTADLEHRRSLRTYGLQEGQRLFGVALHSPALRLSGLLDMLILSADEAIPVEYKNTRRKPGRNHHHQLAAYALLVEEVWQRPVWRAFFYLIPGRRASEVSLEHADKQRVLRTIEDIREMVAHERMPAPTRQRGRCVDCEYRLYCADVEPGRPYG